MIWKFVILPLAIGVIAGMTAQQFLGDDGEDPPPPPSWINQLRHALIHEMKAFPDEDPKDLSVITFDTYNDPCTPDTLRQVLHNDEARRLLIERGIAALVCKQGGARLPLDVPHPTVWPMHGSGS